MSNIDGLAVELQLQILYLATHLDHPKALEYPLINWHSKTSMFFERTVKRRRACLATKASIVLACRQWNKIATPWLYEHVAVDSKAKLETLIQALEMSTPRVRDLALSVKRLDIELAEAIQPISYHSIARLLSFFPNVVTLVMMHHKDSELHLLLSSIPPTVKHLFWSQPMLGALHLPQARLSPMLDFLESHTRLITVSLPFVFSHSEVLSTESYASRSPNQSICQWFILNGTQFFNFAIMAVKRQMCPNTNSRSVTCDWQTQDIGVSALLTCYSPYPLEGSNENTRANLRITHLSLSVPLDGNEEWPLPFLLDTLSQSGPFVPTWAT